MLTLSVGTLGWTETALGTSDNHPSSLPLRKEPSTLHLTRLDTLFAYWFFFFILCPTSKYTP